MKSVGIMVALVAVAFVVTGCGGGNVAPTEIGITPMAGVQLPPEVARDSDGRVIVQTPQVWTTFGFSGDVVVAVSDDRVLDVSRIGGTQTYRVLPMYPGLASVTFSQGEESVTVDVKSAPPTPAPVS